MFKLIVITSSGYAFRGFVMFVGVALEGSNKKYSQTTERPVHISMAALDPFQSHGTLLSLHNVLILSITQASKCGLSVDCKS